MRTGLAWGTHGRKSPEEIPLSLDRLYRDAYGRLLAGLIRVVRDVQLAEDALQEAFAAAIEQWRVEPPANGAS